MAPKRFDIILWGCTGFTGRLALRYLASVAGKEVSFAVGGRSQSKLESVLREEDVNAPIVVADAGDEESLLKMIQQTKLIISLVGPYNLYGSSLVKVCAENGVHYLDLTGEAAWQAKMIKQHAGSAVSSGALIIHASGYDSLPSDLCAFLAVQRLKRLVGPTVRVGDVKAVFALKGGFSGGTLATVLEALESDAETRKANMNPYVLSPIPGKHKPRPQLVYSSTFEGKKTWGAFWLMGGTNSAVVRRSWGVLEESDPSSRVLSYGPDFAYDEFLQAQGPLSAALTSLVLFFSAFLLFVFPPARWALKKWGPKPGEGPSVELQTNGWFRVITTATTVDKRSEVQVTMNGKGDPGYSATSKMIVESALAIVKDWEKLPPIARRGGPLTPATALGRVLVERLEATGFFTFTEVDGKPV